MSCLMIDNPVLIQLPLPFDTLPAVGSIYKTGDWVKVLKKPAIAASVKKGQIFRINTVHPVDGSLRFWNPQTSQWDFLYPDEVKLALAPPAVEDTPPPPQIDSVSPASTIADTEYTAEVADTEYTAEVADTEYTAEVADSDSASRAISTYRPRGTARSGEYFRFSYRDGSRMKHIHIRGGNTDSLLAIARVEEVRSLLAIGVSPLEVAAVIRAC
jgi:hypothetical protein